MTAELPGFVDFASLKRSGRDLPADSQGLQAAIDLLDFLTNNDDRNYSNIGVDGQGRVRGIDAERAFAVDDRYSNLWMRHYRNALPGERLPAHIDVDPGFLAKLKALDLEALTTILAPAHLSADEIHRAHERIRFLVDLVAATGPRVSRESLSAFRTRGLTAE